MEPILLLVILIILVICSAFYAASEIAIVSIPQVQVAQMRISKPKVAKYLDFHRKNAQRFVINISIANNFINILASALATATMIAIFPNYGVLISTIGMTIFILLFGEIIPKVIAINHTKLVAEKSAFLLWISAIVLTPLIWVFSLVVRLFSKNDVEKNAISETSLLYYMQKGLESGAINSSEGEYIRNIMNLDKTNIKNIMIEKENVVSMPDTATIKQVIGKLKKSGFSRVPIFSGKNKSEIIGIVYVKDILGISESKKVTTVMRKPFFVSEMKTVDSLLQDFQREDTHLAVVLALNGDYVGIVTAEDTIEEIIGEIYDETDKKVTYFKKINNKTFHVEGHYLLVDFNKKFKTQLRGATTLSGYITTKLKHLPQKNDVVQFPKGSFTVMTVSNFKAKKIKFVRAFDK